MFGAAAFGIYIVGFCWLHKDGSISHDPVYPFSTIQDAREAATAAMHESSAEWRIINITN